MKQLQEVSLPRTTSSSYRVSTRKIIPSTNPAYFSGSSAAAAVAEPVDVSDKFLLQKTNSQSMHRRRLSRPATAVSSLLRSLLSMISIPAAVLPTCKWLSMPTAHLSVAGPSGSRSLGSKVTGTLYGHRRGQVSFAVQDHPGSEPVLVLDLAMSTSALVKEMSSGLVRIALECEKTLAGGGSGRPAKLFQEPMWTMYCNGRKCGYAVSRACSEPDWHVLRTVHRVSVGAGVIPVVDDGQKGSRSEGELLYMRAKFERVVGSRDSEAFYMLNPDGNGGPELSIFLLRI